MLVLVELGLVPDNPLLAEITVSVTIVAPGWSAGSWSVPDMGSWEERLSGVSRVQRNSKFRRFEAFFLEISK